MNAPIMKYKLAQVAMLFRFPTIPNKTVLLLCFFCIVIYVWWCASLYVYLRDANSFDINGENPFGKVFVVSNMVTGNIKWFSFSSSSLSNHNHLSMYFYFISVAVLTSELFIWNVCEEDNIKKKIAF